MRKILPLILFLICNISVHSYNFEIANIDFPSDMVNRVNSEGLKEGVWVNGDSRTNRFSICYYKNGQKEGVESTYWKILKAEDISQYYLASIITYKDDKYSEVIITYYENGQLWFLIRDIKAVTDFNPTPENYFSTYKFPYQGYTQTYSENGVLIEEGPLLFDEDFFYDIQEVGEWKYYDESGNLIRTHDWGE